MPLVRPEVSVIRSRGPRAGALLLALGSLGAAGCGSSRLDLGSNPASDCVAGVYAGTYSCPTLPGLSSPDLALTLILTADPTADGTPPRTLTLAPGSGAFGANGVVSASNAFSGTVDCATRRLVGAVSGSRGSFGDLTGGINRSGPISAEYLTSPGPPHFTGGVASLDADASAEGRCTWTATLR